MCMYNENPFAYEFWTEHCVIITNIQFTQCTRKYTSLIIVHTNYLQSTSALVHLATHFQCVYTYSPVCIRMTDMYKKYGCIRNGRSRMAFDWISPTDDNICSRRVSLSIDRITKKSISQNDVKDIQTNTVTIPSTYLVLFSVHVCYGHNENDAFASDF